MQRSRNKRLCQTTLHRRIMNANDGEEIDHIDGNRLNNARDNLRFCSRLENNRNRPGWGKKGLPKGVSKITHGSRFQSMIMVHGRQVYLGSRDSVEEAAKLYNDAAKRMFAEFYRNPTA